MRSSSVLPSLSNRQSSTFVALAENSEKLTPSPVHVAPGGCGRPSFNRGSGGLGMKRASLKFARHKKWLRYRGAIIAPEKLSGGTIGTTPPIITSSGVESRVTKPAENR